jgi:hypothetical protein
VFAPSYYQCPVIEGTKRIVTQWIRLGVSEEDPWDSFDTDGRKISDYDDEEEEVDEVYGEEEETYDEE